ncbi:hypothetical protein DL766_001232 [Monosporascus sp. MC13-8B]|uniref:DUF4048 domain-containing protein n=1 Tax=Monosporascus cannonballus TaxID=155416 RepID=A0ABY0HN83_9PEZI|nr:hypothetical protein DL762_000363 [Monosporascus cannonballus]RYO96944.1 hypothetical protein DL763_002981 [Monosporascus cannonballus]RYP37935.1 hypothetical protein DL766_001232 [Monosporascus sp. MC13-8B]
MSVAALRRSRDLSHQNDITLESRSPATEQTRSGLIGRVLRRNTLSKSNRQLSSPEQRGPRQPQMTHDIDTSDNTMSRQPQRQSVCDSKPLPPPPDAAAPTNPKPTLRSRFNKGSGSGSGSGSSNALEPDGPRKSFVPKHAATDFSRMPLSLRDTATYSHNPPTKSDRRSIPRPAQPAPAQPAPARGDFFVRGRISSGHCAAYIKDDGPKRATREEPEEPEGPSDYELFIQQAQEEDRHCREQLLRIMSQRTRTDAQPIRHPDLSTGVFSWQRTATKRRKDGEQRRTWGGESPSQNLPGERRNSDAGPSSRDGDGGDGSGLRKRGSRRASLSNIKKTIANYIKPPRPPSTHKE